MNTEKMCYGCFREKEPGVCPHCGYDEMKGQPFSALPPGTILNGRYVAGKALSQEASAIVYAGYDLKLEAVVEIREYMPQGIAARGEDGYVVEPIESAAQEYRDGLERFQHEMRTAAGGSRTDGMTVQDCFRENGTAYAVLQGTGDSGKTGSIEQRVTAGVTERAANLSTVQDEKRENGFLKIMKENALLRWLIIGAAAAVVVFAVIFPAAGVYGGKELSSVPGEDTVPSTTQEASVPSAAPTITPTPEKTPEPTPSAPEMVKTDLGNLSASIDIPAGWTEDAESWTFTNPEGTISLFMEFYDYPYAAPIYSMSDIEANIDALVSSNVQAVVGEGSSTILATERHEANGTQGIRTDLTVTTAEGSVGMSLLYAEGKNGFGCYLIGGMYPPDDAYSYSIVRSAMDSFTVNGAAMTDSALFTDSRLDFKFLYDTTVVPDGVEVTEMVMNDSGEHFYAAFLYPVSGNRNIVVEVENGSPAGATAAEVLEKLSGAFTASYPSHTVGEPATNVAGGVEWQTRSYLTNIDGTDYVFSFSAADIGGKPYGVGIKTDEANQQTATLAATDILQTLRPV